MTEFFDLYTADRVPLGRKIQRGAPIPKGEFHIVVQIMTINNKGEILLTQRVPTKTSGGKWECSGGCAVAGENSREAAARELYEETGIRTFPDEISLEWTLTTDSMLRDFYIVNKDIPLEKIRLQSTEVCAAKWVSFERLEEMVQCGQTTRTVSKWLELRRRDLCERINEIKNIS
ncbi:MAG: NUDIX domain-containing protein [Oscillospiraceae bacterium]|nr:NUDIX domain-containing protein [Oscillospiraceae bacterium]MBQ4164728.1 NUDIX domain-containing protein [Oscillospiraceae bacterium]